MSRRDEKPDYDYFVIERVPSNGGLAQWAETPKSQLLLFKRQIKHTEEIDIELWVPKSISEIKPKDDNTLVLQVESWWCQKQEELS